MLKNHYILQRNKILLFENKHFISISALTIFDVTQCIQRMYIN